MDINQFSTYSILALSCNKSEAELIKIIEQSRKFEEINDVDSAKKYLKTLWGIEESIKNHALCDKCTLNVVESENTFCINIVCPQENVTYHYTK